MSQNMVDHPAGNARCVARNRLRHARYVWHYLLAYNHYYEYYFNLYIHDYGQNESDEWADYYAFRFANAIAFEITQYQCVRFLHM